MPTKETRSHVAVRVLRNIPAPALLSVVKNQNYANAVTLSSQTLTDDAFAHLWDQAKSPISRRALVARHLSPVQRGLVLAGKLSAPIALSLLKYNDLTRDEALCLQTAHASKALCELLMERYINDNAVLAHLRPALDSGTSMFIAFRAGTIAASDDEVVALVAKYYYNVCREGNTSPSSQVVRLRALIELRPHLIDRLLDATPSTALREAIAHSRHVHDHRLLARLLETTLDQLNETLVSTAHASVTWALISNPVTDPGVRAALIAQDDTQSHNWSSYFAVAFPSQVSPNYDEVTDLTVIQTLTDHMLSRGQHHVSWGLVKWDLLLLARNPHLTPDQALDILNGLDDKPLRRHAGDYLVVPVRAVLCAQLKSVLTPDFVPHRVNLSMDTKPKQWYPSTSETVRSSFSKDTLGSKDAASLTEVLGDNPQAWIAFFGLLDSADSLTPTLKVAATARRLATA